MSELGLETTTTSFALNNRYQGCCCEMSMPLASVYTSLKHILLHVQQNLSLKNKNAMTRREARSLSCKSLVYERRRCAVR